MNHVKQKQNELGIKKSQFPLDLRSEIDSRPVQQSKIINQKLNKSHRKSKKQIKHKDMFKTLLLKLFTMYKQFPKYMIELMAEDCKIPHSEITILIKRFEKKEMLIPVKNDYYTVRKIS
ncbi:MAG: hypothetical protein ACFFAH_17070 [Promethearchaeota archaeon]